MCVLTTCCSFACKYVCFHDTLREAARTLVQDRFQTDVAQLMPLRSQTARLREVGNDAAYHRLSQQKGSARDTDTTSLLQMNLTTFGTLVLPWAMIPEYFKP